MVACSSLLPFLVLVARLIPTLLMSKWMAKRAYGVQVIENPSNADEQWLVQTVESLAKRVNVKTEI